MEVKVCGCGSPMSYFEEENYQMCGACKQKEIKEEQLKFEEEAKRKEEEKKQQEREEREQKMANERSLIEEALKKSIGKTIEGVSINDWTDAKGLEAKQATLHFSDGSKISFSQEEYADGCHGYYDYYQYLGIEFNER